MLISSSNIVELLFSNCLPTGAIEFIQKKIETIRKGIKFACSLLVGCILGLWFSHQQEVVCVCREAAETIDLVEQMHQMVRATRTKVVHLLLLLFELHTATELGELLYRPFSH